MSIDLFMIVRAKKQNTIKAPPPELGRVERPKTKSVEAKSEQRGRADVVDERRGSAKAGDAPAQGTVAGGQARKSAVHARMQALGGEPIANAKKSVSPETHPELFWNGKQKWKPTPPNVEVVVNTDNVDGRGWIEKWKNADGKWVHNYTLEEMARKAGEKFVHNAAFARNIGELREQVGRDLKRGVDDNRALTALVVAIIDSTYIRVGNESSTKRSQGDADKQDTYGITTMLGRHLSIEGRRAVFTFVGKSEVPHTKVVDDPRLVAMLKKLDERTGPDDELFAKVKADDVNKWLEPFGGTAKSFRTYHATRLARDAFAAWSKEHPSATAEEREKHVLDVAAGVAEKLGHTPAVCLKSYIDPAVVELFVRGKVQG